MPAQAELDHAIELLDRALGYTRGVLAELTSSNPALTRRTPCREWDLGQLLAHMEDGLDAFTEGAGGTVSAEPRIPIATRVQALRVKACSLLGVWSSQRPDLITIGDQVAPASVVVAAAALEITVHGWDVAQAVGCAAPIPAALADSLLPVADALVSPHDRGSLFEPALHIADGSSAHDRLLAQVGRGRAVPPSASHTTRTPGPAIAS